MPLQATSGAASYDAFGGGVAAVPTYIEDVFSTYLYTGNDTSQTITNGIDLSTYGGLVWTKNRTDAVGHRLKDTTLGTTYFLESNSTSAQIFGNYSWQFNSNGYQFSTGNSSFNYLNSNYASWTFRKAPKFFDVVTYTGTGVARTIAHSLGSVPACIIVKCTNAAGKDWHVYHTSLGNASYINLNLTSASTSSSTIWNSTTPTSTVFSLGADGLVNDSGDTYVAYIYAHNAGGFGLTGTDNVISCGSYTGNGSATGPVVTLGYEPQWVMVKRTDSASNWTIFDTMRGMSQTAANLLYPNVSDDEGIGTQGWVVPNATGFQLAITQSSVNASGGTYIYIAIRRGPMKVPTSGTSVYNAISRTGTGATANVTGVGFPPDMLLDTMRSTNWTRSMWDRLRGPNLRVATNQTSAETSYTDAVMSYNQDGVTLGADGNFDVNASGYTYINWFFRRAPSFFDEVCYTGTGAVQNVSHNLAAVPELMILKQRNGVTNWMVYHSALGNTKAIYLDSTSAASSASAGFWNNTSPTSSVFTVSMVFDINGSGSTSVAYLFATCAGVSKVGSYTGTATTLQVDCGFTGGARFVLIKRTDSTGDWYVWDTARGIVSGNDPYLLLNSTAAETTGTDYIDTYSAGFEISSTAPTAINASGGTFIFLAIA